MGDAFWTSANFVEQTAECGLAFLKEIKRKAAAANMAAALQLDYPAGFYDRRASMLESEFRPALDAMVLKAGGVKFSDLTGTRRARSDDESIWFQFVRAHRVNADLGLAAVVYVWERVTRDWNRDVLKDSSVRVSVPRDARLLMFATLQHAVHEYVYPEPWMIMEPDLKRFRATIVEGLVQSCVTINGRVSPESRDKVYRELTRSLSPNVVRLSDGAVPFVMPPRPEDAMVLNKFEPQEKNELVQMPAPEKEVFKGIEVPTRNADTEAQDPIAADADVQTDPLAAEADVQTDPLVTEAEAQTDPLVTEADVQTDPLSVQAEAEVHTDPPAADADVQAEVQTDTPVTEAGIQASEADVVETGVQVDAPVTEDLEPVEADVETQDPTAGVEEVTEADAETQDVETLEPAEVTEADVETLVPTEVTEADAEPAEVTEADVETKEPAEVAEADVETQEPAEVTEADVETKDTEGVEVTGADVETQEPEDVEVTEADVETQEPADVEVTEVKTQEPEDVEVTDADVETQDPADVAVTEADVETQEPTKGEAEVAKEPKVPDERTVKPVPDAQNGGIVLDAYF